MGNVRRRRYPLQSGGGIIHLTFPTAHFYYLQFTLHSVLEHSFSVEHLRKFAAGQPVNVRNFVLAYKRKETVLYQTAFNSFSAKRIGTVKNDEFFIVFRCCFHGKSHGAYVGERATSYILNVIYQNVYVFQHFGCGFTCFAKQRINRKSRNFVFLCSHALPGVSVSANSVFGTEQSHKVHIFCFVQYVYVAFKIVVHTGRICY